MQLYRWRGNERNFGDELNCLLWPRLLPNFFDDDAAVLFLGIGSVLDARHPAGAVKLVAGAGYGGYESSPTLDARWVIHWVRGPRTARVLCLPITCGLGDPAMLLAAPPTDGGRAIGFMPHFESLGRGAWAEAARAAGMTLIDPRDDPDAIIAAIGGCRLLLSEAMHGVIVADAMRVPWVALRPLVAVHRAKWQDWADTLGLAVRFQPLPPSSLVERLHASSLAKTHAGRRLLVTARPKLDGAAPDGALSSGRRVPWPSLAAPNRSYQTRLRWTAVAAACSSGSTCCDATHFGTALLPCTAPVIPPTTGD